MNPSGIKIKKKDAERLERLNKNYFEMVDWEPFFNLMRAYFPDCTIVSDVSKFSQPRQQTGHFVYNNGIIIIMSTMVCFSESKPVYYFPGVDLQIACEDLHSTYSLDELAEMLKKARVSGKI